MLNNVINNCDGDIYGFYSDIKEYLKAELINEIQADNFGAINESYGEMFEELEKFGDYDGLLKVSENNGMGLTVSEYRGEDFAQYVGVIANAAELLENIGQKFNGLGDRESQRALEIAEALKDLLNITK